MLCKETDDPKETGGMATLPKLPNLPTPQRVSLLSICPQRAGRGRIFIISGARPAQGSPDLETQRKETEEGGSYSLPTGGLFLESLLFRQLYPCVPRHLKINGLENSAFFPTNSFLFSIPLPSGGSSTKVRFSINCFILYLAGKVLFIR